MATSRDVAQRAGVSQSTVSRALSGHPGVTEEVRRRVQAAARDLLYVPNAAARTMRTSRSGNIGVVTARLHNPIYPEMLQLLGRELRLAGLRMIVWNSDETDEGAAADAARQGMVDGIIFTSATQASTALYEEIAQRLPVVLVNRTVEGWPCDQVASDNHAGGRAVADYFRQAGRRRIGLLSGPLWPSTIREREAGFLEGCLDGPPMTVRTEAFTYTAGAEGMGRLLALADRPDAVFCANDVLALGARDAARLAGVAVPGEVWLVGYDDIAMASWTAFDLTTIRQPIEEMVREAVRLLLQRLAGEEAPRQRLCLPGALVVRGTTERLG
ncbi:LacI family transcriptional regulator [Humitalea rosea]|uniref:LacI family transcriptional regulator n=1 Tax=Humitalea rosea TaxID=990373 RepID=A0A2W7INK1_9PROT|nr:LacI family DNA-binding transcriptional regulator [Humitalea rosea]PZW49079.1 LacI family transcriptional regulator [Humitalea rosea]